MINLFRKYLYFVLAMFFLGGIAAGVLSDNFFKANNLDTSIHPVREKDIEYAFINPLLFYDGPNSSDEYSDILDSIEKIVNNFVDEKPDNKASVYYRDLSKGHWVGVNEDDEYVPGSMLKVVIMIACLKEAENNPNILATEVKISKDIKSLIDAKPYDRGSELEFDKSYTVQELIDRMIINSDNGAMYTLVSVIDRNVLSQVYTDLGLGDPVDKGADYTISAKNYASFFRLLYNATYINRTMSEKALSILSKSDFKEGLVSGVPEPIIVSHKYGERVISGLNKNIDAVELHDCGIVYYPQHPYVLCVMTKGKDLNRLSEVISDISKTIYEHAAEDTQ